MPDFNELDKRLPVAPLRLIVLDSAAALGSRINDYLVSFRQDAHLKLLTDPAFKGYALNDYRIDCDTNRYESGEGRANLQASSRGDDIFILTDVMNHSLTYQMRGFTNYMSPDDHYLDLKRVIASIGGRAKRINVIMPFMYESRQHKRTMRESLDCATMIDELMSMGVDNFITFDAHDPRVSNAAPLSGFNNFLATYQFVKAMLSDMNDLIVNKEHLTVISPDEGALDRAVYFANVLSADTGMFYKRRDYTKVVNGKNPIVAHEYLGEDVTGKDVIIIDDMIASGSSIIDTAGQLKKRKAGRVFLCSTFGLFTEGLEAFDAAYEKGVFDRVIATNLTYQFPGLAEREWFLEADMSKFVATIIDFINHDASITGVMTPTEKIHEFIRKYNMGIPIKDILSE